ncbi:hypothetical protein MKL09_09190 [Methylobacterium sp. J-048]|uniref:hypothetical protein n=1 Tax=Methylobacterium sp. J-048 TaxID=2836635 RepID=UPI001FBAE839|nr:hypothetical protein [Methylobacterium sp. J-048]MCJ2056728.1 hypothetical protein [Methylobacterium sp. J-048]
MPYGARTSLAALILSLALGATGARAEQASGWTDPPARKPAPAASPAEAQKAVPPPASSPAAAAPARKAVAARPVQKRVATHRPAPEAKRVATTAHRPRVAAAPVRTVRPHRMVAVAPPPPPPDAYPRYRAYNYGPGYADERLERLRAAEAAGYLVVRRRTVEFPDGRSLRVYRPDDEGEPF